MKQKDVIVVGAGPYGLSIAAHLRGAGVEPYVIGQPLAFWKRSMPPGMFLRSRIEASNIAAPTRDLGLIEYERAIRRKLPEPLPIEDFIAYGDWFQARVAPNLDTRAVSSIARNGTGFAIALEDGEHVHAKSVVLALGIGLFATRPAQFLGLSKDLVLHSSEFNDPSQFIGKRVAVIGRGQSALEFAALLHEKKAHVELLTRSSTVDFLGFAWRKHLFRRLTPGPLKPLSYLILPPTDLGDIRTARKMADPEKFRRQSPEIQKTLLKDVTTPRGAYWLPARLEGVRIRTNVTVSGVEFAAGGLKLVLSDGTHISVDHVVLGTGYRIDISKYRVLDASLLHQVEATADGYPVLTGGLETSVNGLFMAGVIAEKTLGPTLRFVTGTSNAGPRVAKAIAQRISQSL
jgi:thioredoxin reductase